MTPDLCIYYFVFMYVLCIYDLCTKYIDHIQKVIPKVIDAKGGPSGE